MIILKFEKKVLFFIDSAEELLKVEGLEMPAESLVGDLLPNLKHLKGILRDLFIKKILGNILLLREILDELLPHRTVLVIKPFLDGSRDRGLL